MTPTARTQSGLLLAQLSGSAAPLCLAGRRGGGGGRSTEDCRPEQQGNTTPDATVYIRVCTAVRSVGQSSELNALRYEAWGKVR